MPVGEPHTLHSSGKRLLCESCLRSPCAFSGEQQTAGGSVGGAGESAVVLSGSFLFPCPLLSEFAAGFSTLVLEARSFLPAL